MNPGVQAFVRAIARQLCRERGHSICRIYGQKSGVKLYGVRWAKSHSEWAFSVELVEALQHLGLYVYTDYSTVWIYPSDRRPPLSLRVMLS